MKVTNFFPRRSLLASAAASLALFAAPTVAQQNNPPADDPPNDDPPAESTESSSEPAPESTSEPPAESTTSEEEETSTTEAPPSTTEPPTTTSQVRVSGGDALTTGDVIGSGEVTLTMHVPIPTYPPPAVPPTVDAPFMQQSTAPEGTVFIAVGAILGALGLGILLWRFIVTIMLRRSVQRAALAQHDSGSKTGFPAPPAPFYKYTDQGSTMSLSGGAALTKGQRRTTRGPIPSTNLSQSNLFFSPTAAASTNAGGNRSSAFLPSGFYAAGTSSPGGGHHGHSISLTNLRPDSRGAHANPSRLNPSPPQSPGYPTARRDMSTSSLNLSIPPTGRAPSAYLEDLLADDPGSLPPPHITPGGGQRSSTHMTNRTGSSRS